MVHFWGHTTWRCDSKKIIATGSKWKHKLMIARPKFCYCATSAAHPKCAKTLSKKKLQLISIKFCFDWKKFLTPSSILSKNFFSIGSKSDFNETSLKRRSQRSLSRSETRGFPEWRWSRDQKKRKYFLLNSKSGHLFPGLPHRWSSWDSFFLPTWVIAWIRTHDGKAVFLVFLEILARAHRFLHLSSPV